MSAKDERDIGKRYHWKEPKSFDSYVEGDTRPYPLHSVGQLHWTLRLLMALNEMSYKPVEIAKILETKTRIIHKWLNKLQKSTNPIIVQAMRDGLPPEACTTLIKGKYVYCPSCRHEIDVIPCLACALKKLPKPRLTDNYREHRDAQRAQAVLYRPTFAAPGSDDKIRVLERRLKFGRPLFHAADLNINTITDEVTIPRREPQEQCLTEAKEGENEQARIAA